MLLLQEQGTRLLGRAVLHTSCSRLPTRPRPRPQLPLPPEPPTLQEIKRLKRQLQQARQRRDGQAVNALAKQLWGWKQPPRQQPPWVIDWEARLAQVGR
jgi:hypothetical protein